MNDAIQHKLGERVKELTALHRTARILQDHGRPASELIREIVALLPDAWQHPEIASARILFRGGEYATAGFRETEWRQRADFVTRGGERGGITVCYSEPRPEADEGPFLAEERDLIDSLAEMLRSHLEHMVADQALVEAHNALEAQVLERTADLRRLASRLTIAEERERRRIASDLHDHVGQALAFIKTRVREFQGNAMFGGFEDSIQEILKLLDQTIHYTRDLTGEISPPVLYELGLEPALDWLAERFSGKRGFPVRLLCRGEARPLPEETGVILFASARELLFNSFKHSGAAAAEMELTWSPGAVTVTVIDAGGGFDPSRPATPGENAFGLFSIRERFRDLGGEVTVETAPGEGCRVELRAPLAGGGDGG